MNRKWGIVLSLAAAALTLTALTLVVSSVLLPPKAAAEPIDQTRLADMTGAMVTADGDDLVVSESVKEFIDKGKPIGHVIILLLVIAVFFLADQLRVHLLEKLRGREIYRTDMKEFSAREFEEVVARNGKSRIGRLLSDAAGMFRQSANVSLIGSEAEFYREKEEHRFNTFESRMAFLADTAGGLGLLGTVWGIYRGFAAKAGAQSNDDLLAAMGIALVTTFMGIVVSVIINWMSTEMGAAFRARIMAATEKIEDYREVLVKDIGRSA